jgi:hypothetical protein
LFPAFTVQFPGAVAPILVHISRSMGMWSSHRPSIPHTGPKVFSYLCSAQ